MKIHLVRVSLGVVVLAAAGPAIAEQCPQATSPAQAQELAGAAFADGQQLVDEGNLAGALGRFQCSYSLAPHPNTLYNMGECAEGLGRNDEALEFFREYLSRFPDAEDRSEVEARAARLEALVPPPQEQPPPQEVREPVEPQPVAPTSPLRRTRMSTGRILAWVTLGTGAALAIAGIGVYGGSLSVNSEFEEIQADFDPDSQDRDDVESELETLADKGHALEVAGWVLMGVGLATLTASILLFVIPDAEVEVTASRRRLSFSVAPLLGQAQGLSLSGRF